tara:strand:+ start:154 stop:567 length:414 start_codon:yes stop_codon:yes gene_type:complete
MEGSIINILAKNGCYASDNEPYVGMGATYNSYSDRHPLTVVNVIKKKNHEIVVCREDNAVRVDKNGMSECQDYEYSPNVNGTVYYLRSKKVVSSCGEPTKIYERVRKNEESGRWNIVKFNKTPVSFGSRNKYHDFSF